MKQSKERNKNHEIKPVPQLSRAAPAPLRPLPARLRATPPRLCDSPDPPIGHPYLVTTLDLFPELPDLCQTFIFRLCNFLGSFLLFCSPNL